MLYRTLRKATSTNMRKNMYVVTPRCVAAAAVVSAVVLRRPTKEYTNPYSMMHRRLPTAGIISRLITTNYHPEWSSAAARIIHTPFFERGAARVTTSNYYLPGYILSNDHSSLKSPKYIKCTTSLKAVLRYPFSSMLTRVYHHTTMIPYSWKTIVCR